MKVFVSPLPAQLPLRPRVVALGSFDGLHLGHQAVLRRTMELARKHQATSAALTFDRPPGLFFNHSGKHRFLTTVEQKTRLIEQLGLEEMILLTFDARLASLSPYEFAAQVLKDSLGAFLITCGPGHRFGAAGAGNCLSLVSSGLSLSAEIVPPVNYQGQPISSTRIREFLDNGNLEATAHCLGRPYSITGTQVPGEGRGASLGFPTVNLDWDRLQQLPPEGVYACQVATIQQPGHPNFEFQVSGSECASELSTRNLKLETRNGVSPAWAAVSLGKKPTFGGSSLSLELHFVEQPPKARAGEIYEVFFLRHLRDQIRFESGEALKQQIAQDCLAVREVAAAQTST